MAPLRYRRGLLTVLPFLTLGLLGRPIRQRATDHTLRAVVGLVLLVQLWAPVAAAQVVGDRVLLVERALGIPGHPAPGNNAVSYRFPGGTAVAIRAIDTATGWFRVEDDTAHSAWITRTYIASIVPPPPTTPTTVSTGQCHEVGLWNLEHFGKGKARGFPEYTYTPKGPTYPPRSTIELSTIADAIRDVLRARILVLTEINGSHDEEDTRRQRPQKS